MEGLSDIGGRVAHRTGWEDKELTATQLGDEAGQGVSEMDDRLQRRFAQEQQGVGLIENVANAAGELRKQPAGIDDDIGVESGEDLCDRRLRLLVGDGLMDTGEAE